MFIGSAPGGGARGQGDFDFTGHFGDPTDKEGRTKSGVSQSYSTFTGPDGKSNGFFVQDHNNGALPAQHVITYQPILPAVLMQLNRCPFPIYFY